MISTKCIDKNCKGTMLMFIYTSKESCASMWICTRCGTRSWISESDWNLIIDKVPIKNKTGEIK